MNTTVISTNTAQTGNYPSAAVTQRGANKPATTAALQNTPGAGSLTPTQAAAVILYNLGLNVIPIPPARKGGWPWKPLQFTRLPASTLIPLFSGQCNIAVMCGKTSDNLFVIDCETKEAFEEQGQKLHARNIPYWSVKSGGAGGGGHYYLRCEDGEIENIPSGEISDVEIRGNRCYVLAPPSIHPDTGAFYHWEKREGQEIPRVRLEELDWLPLKLTSKTRKSPVHQSNHSNLSRKTQEFIAHGAQIGERNNRLFAAACDMAGNGYSFQYASDILTPVALHCGLSGRETADTIGSAFNSKREPSRSVPSNYNEPKQWERVLAWIQEQSWKGRTGQTDRSVLLACCERARVGMNENGLFRASVRELAELAQVSKPTVINALRRLRKAGWIIQSGRDRGSSASLYRFGEELAAPMRSFTTIPPWLSNSGKVVLVSDAGERGALGKTAMMVYLGLLDYGGVMKPKALAVYCRLSYDQVVRALRKLVGYSLVSRGSDGWRAVRVDAEWLDEHVAVVAGTYGKGEARRVRHEKERGDYAARQLFGARCVMESYDSGAAQSVSDSHMDVAGTAPYWQCPNCGQLCFGDLPPDICDYCRDFTTWRRADGSESDAPVSMDLGDSGEGESEGVDSVVHPRLVPPPGG